MSLPRQPHRRGLLIALSSAALIAGGAASAGAAPRCSVAIENVNLIAMDAAGVRPGQTVRFNGPRIAAIGPTRTVSGAGCARRIDGAGKYLVPGLIDSHVHVESEAFAQVFGLKDASFDFPELLLPYLASGVTGVRVLSGAPDLLAFRKDRLSDPRPTPRMALASPMLSGTPPVLPAPVARILATPEEGAAAVREYAAAGYDLVKIRNNLSAPILQAVHREAKRLGLPVDGHVPDFVRAAPERLGADQDAVAHVNELSLMVRDAARDPAVLAARLRASGGYVTSTLVVDTNVAAQLSDYPAMAARPEMRFLHPMMVGAFWLEPNNPYRTEGADPAFFRGLVETDRLVVRALREAGVPLLAGTDAMSPMIIPGISMHEELELLVAAGLTPFEALQAATVTPARVIKRFNEAGVLAPGRAADAVLVEGDPLADLAVLRRPLGVVVGGVWLDRAALDRGLEALAAKYAR